MRKNTDSGNFEFSDSEREDIARIILNIVINQFPGDETDRVPDPSPDEHIELGNKAELLGITQKLIHYPETAILKLLKRDEVRAFLRWLELDLTQLVQNGKPTPTQKAHLYQHMAAAFEDTLGLQITLTRPAARNNHFVDLVRAAMEAIEINPPEDPKRSILKDVKSLRLSNDDIRKSLNRSGGKHNITDKILGELKEVEADDLEESEGVTGLPRVC
jgi:hypothetical protein